MTLFLGMDLSTKKIAAVGFSDLSDQAQLWMETIGKQSVAFHPEVLDKAYSATLRIAQELRELGKPNEESVIFVEAPIHGRGIKTTISLGKISGAVQLALFQSGFGPKEVNVSTWKKVVCGNGRASKEDVDRIIRSKWSGVYAKTGGEQDIVDAAAVCLYGVIQNSGQRQLES